MYCVFAFFILIYKYMAVFLIESTSGLVQLLIYLFFKFNKSEKTLSYRYVIAEGTNM